MDCSKTGQLISDLRKEKGLTQQNVADALNISNKTVSKWECGLGCPDVSLWPELSVILNIDIRQMIEGEIVPNLPDSGNIEKIRFYVCPTCKNVLMGTGSAALFCCGRKLEALEPALVKNAPSIEVLVSDMDYFITIDHPMARDHYLLFAAYVKSEKVLLTRLYPEQDASLRLPYWSGGKLYLYCTRYGLSVRSIS